MNVTALPLPAQEGIHFCEIDGKPFFRVIDLADKFFPQKSPYRANMQARTATRLLIDKKRPTMKNVTKGAERRGQYLPLVTMEEATDLFQDPSVRREVSNQSGALIGWIIKEKRMKAAMTETEPKIAEPEAVKGSLITPIDDMVFCPKPGAGGSIVSVPAISVRPDDMIPFDLVLRGGAVFIEAMAIAKIIAPGISDTSRYEAIKATGRLLINCRHSSGGRSRRFIAVDHIDTLAEMLIAPRLRFEEEYLTKIKATIAQALDAWPAAHSKSASEDTAFTATETAEVVALLEAVPPPVSDVVEPTPSQKLLNALENLRRQDEAQTFIINGLRQEIAMVRLAQIEATNLAHAHHDSLAAHLHEIGFKIEPVVSPANSNAPKAARPLLGRLFGIS